MNGQGWDSAKNYMNFSTSPDRGHWASNQAINSSRAQNSARESDFERRGFLEHLQFLQAVAQVDPRLRRLFVEPLTDFARLRAGWWACPVCTTVCEPTAERCVACGRPRAGDASLGTPALLHATLAGGTVEDAVALRRERRAGG